jgi:hypothetical protein
MKSFKIKVYSLLFFSIVSSVLIVTFAISKNGETIGVIKGSVQVCKTLDGTTSDPKPHATIKVETGNYVTAILPDCTVGQNVNVLVKRGAFYFNSVFFAEKTPRLDQ